LSLTAAVNKLLLTNMNLTAAKISLAVIRIYEIRDAADKDQPVGDEYEKLDNKYFAFKTKHPCF